MDPSAHPTKATLKAENHALQCTTGGPYNAKPSNLLGVGSICGLGPDLVGIHSISLAARYRVAACSTKLSQGLDKIHTACGHNCAPLFALSSVWEKEFLAPSMAYSTLFSTANAFDIFCRLGHDGKVATRLLVDKLHEQDFAGPLEPPKFWETTSVLSTKPLQTAHCQRQRALHHCGDPDQFPTTGQTFLDSLSHRVQIVIGKCACMAPKGTKLPS